jgi:hypothetical protein
LDTEPNASTRKIRFESNQISQIVVVVVVVVSFNQTQKIVILSGTSFQGEYK